ncbi:MAG: hypothetical protein EXQ93_05865 [Alphaproteobacteria bacterium]|nr:hypothetical protein [Alphaproteobacteria bacterium]
MYLPRIGLIAAAALSMAACANTNTIDRRTLLNGNDAKDGIAIHLDAQQRVVMARATTYCAEPSPDGLNAYAASLGIGGGVPTQGEATLAQPVQNSAASIGLRTQSITLMRDALYRVCEGFANGALGQVGATTLMARSQDLTAVVLAIEQLTGAVTASQVVLTGTAGANATATIVNNQGNLEAATKNVKLNRKAVVEAQTRRDALQKTLAEKERWSSQRRTRQP